MEKTVAQYYLEKYKITLRYPSLPCLECGSSKKPVSLPMEVLSCGLNLFRLCRYNLQYKLYCFKQVCYILEGQKYSRKLDMQQVTALLKATCQRPYERDQTINKVISISSANILFFVPDFWSL